jgi:outer membrane protein assembly factor BamB
VTRTVTNVGRRTSTYRASTTGLEGIDVTVTPSRLRLKPGRSATFEVTFTQEDAELFSYVGGYLTWTDRTHEVRSPIVIRPKAVGDEDWEAHYDGPGGSFGTASDEGDDVFLHPDGKRLYVGGTSTPPVPGTLVQDFITAAYDPETGDELWSVRYDGSGGGSDEPAGFAMSPDGETVYAAGTSGGDYITLAYDGATGAQKWEAKFDGAAGASDHAEDISVSPDGKTVLVTGSQSMADDGRDFGTVAYDAATGQQRWAATWDDPVHNGDYGTAIAVSPDSSTVVVTGQSIGPEGHSYDWGIAAYDVATGKQAWDAQYNGPASKGDIPNDVAITRAGTVVVTGSAAATGTGNDWGVAGYDLTTGEQQWASTYDGTGSTDVPRAIAVSPDDATVVVTGNSWGSGTSSDYATVGFDATTGAQRWAARHNGSASGLDIAWNLAISEDSSRVVVTGQTAESQTGTDYTTLAYDMGTGEELWKAKYDSTRSFDGGNAVAIDSTPNTGRRVFVTGVSTNSIDPLNDNSDAVTLAYFDPFE